MNILPTIHSGAPSGDMTALLSRIDDVTDIYRPHVFGYDPEEFVSLKTPVLGTPAEAGHFPLRPLRSGELSRTVSLADDEDLDEEEEDMEDDLEADDDLEVEDDVDEDDLDDDLVLEEDDDEEQDDIL